MQQRELVCTDTSIFFEHQIQKQTPYRYTGPEPEATGYKAALFKTLSLGELFIIQM